jgi:hypothetical protein
MEPQVIGRRTVLWAGAGIAARPAAAALPVPPENNLAFRLIRHGSDIGRHTLAFDRDSDGLTVHIAVDAKVSLLSIPIVHYAHQATEIWRGGALASLTGRTNKNGQQEWVQAQRTNEGLEVLGSKTARYIAPPQAIATSYWNKRMLDGPMISLEDGVLLRPRVAERAVDSIPLASGSKIPAEHYNLSGAFNVDVWYDESATWASLAFQVADGSEIRYERV